VQPGKESSSGKKSKREEEDSEEVPRKKHKQEKRELQKKAASGRFVVPDLYFPTLLNAKSKCLCAPPPLLLPRVSTYDCFKASGFVRLTCAHSHPWASLVVIDTSTLKL